MRQWVWWTVAAACAVAVGLSMLRWGWLDWLVRDDGPVRNVLEGLSWPVGILAFVLAAIALARRPPSDMPTSVQAANPSIGAEYASGGRSPKIAEVPLRERGVSRRKQREVPPSLHQAIVVVDIAEFTDPARTAVHQAAAHAGLYEVLRAAFTDAGIDWDACWAEDRGDGALILVPATVPKSVLAARLPFELAGALRRYNAVHSSEARVSLRVVLHAGEVQRNINGVVSQAVNLAFRLLDAGEAKHALKRSGGSLAVIASETFYREVIVQDPAAEPDTFRSIPVVVKNVSTEAWLRLLESAHTAPGGEAVPTVWGNVPPRNPTFTGRDDLLEQLTGRLATQSSAVIVPTAALHGMGGIGKTQLAAEYVYRRLHHYDIVWWIHATQRTQIRASLAQLAQHLDLPGSDNADTAVPAVLEALRLGRPFRRWLLVFDAADSPEVVRPYLPSHGPGETLITSRNPNWTGVASQLEVAVFTRDETDELLRRRGLDVDTDDADQLADKLGDLPLAVDQAAAWQVETGTPIDEYLRLFDEKATEIHDSSANTEYGVSVGAAWNVSFDELEVRNPGAYELLQVCAFYAPEPITRRLFTTTEDVVGDWAPNLAATLGDSIKISRAVRDINRYGLAKVDHRHGTLVVHRLVQLMLRNRMDRRTTAHRRHTAHLLLGNYDPNDPRSSILRQRYHDMLPHVYAADLADCDMRQPRKLTINIARFLTHWGDLEEGAKLAEHVLRSWTKALGESSEETISARLIVGKSRNYRGDFLLAREIAEEIFRDARHLFGDDHALTLQAANDLAVTIRLCGDYRRALTLNTEIYERRRDLLGSDHPDTLKSLSGMIVDTRELGRYREARVQHEECAEQFRIIFGEDKVETLQRLTQLAVARRKDGDHPAALELSTQVSDSYRRIWSDGHPGAMICTLAHSIDLRNADEFDAANEHGSKVLDQLRTKFGPHHPYTLSAMVNLAVTLRQRGDGATARQYDEDALDGFCAALGAEHPHAVSCAVNLTNDLAALGDNDAASALSAKAQERAKRVLSADHPITIAASTRTDCDIDPLPL